MKSLWSFKEDFPELHVVAAGSLLEFALKRLSSFGVGRIRSLFVYPFSFDEFLVAEGKPLRKEGLICVIAGGTCRNPPLTS
ncbi:MAG: AAA family ATPase [Bacteroidales bacterium]|nr:AAA family ATPase [Bacteroidales bacterium]